MRRFGLWMQGDTQTAAFRSHRGPICAFVTRVLRCSAKNRCGPCKYVYFNTIRVIFPLMMWRHRRLDLSPPPIYNSLLSDFHTWEPSRIQLLPYCSQSRLQISRQRAIWLIWQRVKVWYDGRWWELVGAWRKKRLKLATLVGGVASQPEIASRSPAHNSSKILNNINMVISTPL